MNENEKAGALLGRLLAKDSIDVEEVEAALEAIDHLQEANKASDLVNLARAHLGGIHVSNLGATMGNLLTVAGNSRFMSSGRCMKFSEI